MNTREFQSAVLIKLNACMAEIKDTRKLVRAVDFTVQNILPQTHLQPFSKPAQKDVGRDLNVASWFREKTKEENGKLPANAQRKYLEFPDEVGDEQLNEDMKRCMHSIVCERLRPGWETMNWSAIYNADKMLGEQIIKEAALRPEMAVIAQSAGHWAVRTIAEQRQKSTKRAAVQRNTRARLPRGAFGRRRVNVTESATFNKQDTAASPGIEGLEETKSGDRIHEGSTAALKATKENEMSANLNANIHPKFGIDKLGEGTQEKVSMGTETVDAAPDLEVCSGSKALDKKDNSTLHKHGDELSSSSPSSTSGAQAAGAASPTKVPATSKPDRNIPEITETKKLVTWHLSLLRYQRSS